MNINLDNKHVQTLLDAHLITNNGNPKSVEVRWDMVRRLQLHVIEYITALVVKEFKKRKYIPYSKK